MLITKRQQIIAPGDLKPCDPRLRIVGAFNTGAVADPATGDIYYAVRVAAEPKDHPDGFRLAPRFQDGVLQLDPLEISSLDPTNDDPRGLRLKDSGHWRLPFLSYLKILKSSNGFTFDNLDGVDLLPHGPDEEYGLEDCRVTAINGVFHLTYTAVYGDQGVVMPQPHLITTKDFKTFDRWGKIFDGPDKNAILFPEKIAGQYVALHRPQGAGHADIILTRSDDLKNWEAGQHLTLDGEALRGKHRGPGAPPIRTERGWLLLTHKRSVNPNRGTQNSPFIYTGHALMLDGEDPTKIIGWLDGPVIAPKENFEVNGYFGNVVFPTGLIRRNKGALYVSYGAADEFTGAAIIDEKALMKKMNWVKPGAKPDIGALDI
ncbi:MAG: glycoside hydrolase family 130 protein [Micavibrio sp.]